MRKQICNKCGSFQTIYLGEVQKDSRKFKQYRCINCSEIFEIEVI